MPYFVFPYLYGDAAKCILNAVIDIMNARCREILSVREKNGDGAGIDFSVQGNNFRFAVD